MVADNQPTTLRDLISCRVDDPGADVWLRTSGPEAGRPVKTYAAAHVGIRIIKRDALIPAYLYYMLEHLADRGLFADGVDVEQLLSVPVRPT
jgi:hypothetical protein